MKLYITYDIFFDIEFKIVVKVFEQHSNRKKRPLMENVYFNDSEYSIKLNFYHLKLHSDLFMIHYLNIGILNN